MIDKIKNVLNSPFNKNVSKLISGTFIAQGVALLFTPILSRKFLPADFGEFSIFTGISTTLGVLVTLKYELAIVLPKEEIKAKHLRKLSIWLTLVISSLIALVFWLLRDIALVNSKLFFSNELLELLFVFLLSFGIANTFQIWLTRIKEFSYISIGRVTQTAVTNILPIVFIYTCPNMSNELIIGYVGGQVAIGLYYLVKSGKLEIGFPDSNSKTLMRNYRDFPIYNMPHTLMNTLQEFLVLLILNGYFGKTEAGLYFMSYRILRVPIQLVSSSVYQVFLQKVSEISDNKESLQREIWALYKMLSLIGIPVFGIILFLGPFLFSLIFGNQWYDAGVYSQILSPALFFTFLVSPVVGGGIVLRKQNISIMFGVAAILIRVASLLIGGFYNNIYLGLFVLSFASSILMIYSAFWYYRAPLKF